MENITFFLATLGLAHFIQNTDGPWDLVARGRNALLRLPLLGPRVFYKFFSCGFCLGFWSGAVLGLGMPGGVSMWLCRALAVAWLNMTAARYL